MTRPSAKQRCDAVLRDLDPLLAEATDPTDKQQQQQTAWLLTLALAHPRDSQPSHGDARPASRRKRRYDAITLAAGLTGLAGGGVAVAATGGWDHIASSWNDITGRDSQHTAAAPRLVAQGTGTSSGAGPTGATTLQLFTAPTADGGQCESLRSIGFSLDSCHDSQDIFPTTPLTGLTGQAFYRVSYTSRADYLWGHVDPQEVHTVQVSADDRQPVTTTVDPTTGYWVTSIIDTNATHPLTLTATAPDGRTLLTQPVDR